MWIEKIAATKPCRRPLSSCPQAHAHKRKHGKPRGQCRAASAKTEKIVKLSSAEVQQTPGTAKKRSPEIIPRMSEGQTPEPGDLVSRYPHKRSKERIC